VTILFSPDGTLNVAADPSDLPETTSRRDNIHTDAHSGAMVRCKNLRTNQPGKAITRDGSRKLNTTALETAIWWIEEQVGVRYTFAGTQIYKDETSIATGLTSAQWAAIKYNAFNDTVQNVYGLNGTDRKRIDGSTVHEWGIAAPTTKPTLSNGGGTGLTGQFNVKYTYGRKVGDALVAESNGSDAADDNKVLVDQSLGVQVAETPSDTQITHIFLYRTLKDGPEFFLDQELAVGTTWVYGYTHPFEKTDAYFSGRGFKFTETDSNHTTEDTQTWELVFEDRDDEAETVNNDYNIRGENYYSRGYYREL